MYTLARRSAGAGGCVVKTRRALSRVSYASSLPASVVASLPGLISFDSRPAGQPTVASVGREGAPASYRRRRRRRRRLGGRYCRSDGNWIPVGQSVYAAHVTHNASRPQWPQPPC